MALFTFDTIQEERNLDLTDPQGQTIATALIAAVVAWASTVVGFSIEAAARNAYFEDGQRRMYLPSTAPVSNVAVSTYNTVTTSYEAVDSAYVRFSDDGVVEVSVGLPSGFQAVKVSFTTGWDNSTLPKDLRDVLIDLVTLRLQQINNLALTDPTSPSDAATPDTGALKKVQAGSYTEEYSTAQSEAIWKAKAAQLSRSIGDDVPDYIKQTVLRYQRAFAI